MYSLWARKRLMNGKGFPYEFIFDFEDESFKYTALGKIDKSVYQEAMIVKDNKCIMYVELEKPYIKRK